MKDTEQLYNDFDWEITGQLPVLLIRVLTKCSYKLFVIDCDVACRETSRIFFTIINGNNLVNSTDLTTFVVRLRKEHFIH